ncbi:MAG: CHAD domain-containing protein [Coriobacteriia bacterium]|nr:CHAD domain-containing protein [Coriobacteriia bacterium]
MNKRFLIPGVDASTPLAEAAGALLVSKAEPLFELEEAARGGADMDAVHDMRVASRRLREALRLVAPLYNEKPFRKWYRRIRDITRALGPVRDSDVFIDEFSRIASGLGDGGRRAVAWAVGFRMGQRVHELDVLNRRLSSIDLDRSRASFERFAFSAADSAEARRPFGEFAYAAVAERAGAVFGRQGDALQEENVAQQHALRIDYKRLRYAVEAFAPCYGESFFDDLHATLTAFQDALGALHDTHVFLESFTAPDRVEAAARAGVSESDLREVAELLEARAHEQYRHFVELVAANPPDELLPKLLLPLAAVRGSAQDVSADDSGVVTQVVPDAGQDFPQPRGDDEELVGAPSRQ